MKVVIAGILGFAGTFGIFWCGGTDFERGPELSVALSVSVLVGFSVSLLTEASQ